MQGEGCGMICQVNYVCVLCVCRWANSQRAPAFGIPTGIEERKLQSFSVGAPGSQGVGSVKLCFNVG